MKTNIVGTFEGVFLGAVKNEILKFSNVTFNDEKVLQCPCKTDVLQIYVKTPPILQNKDSFHRIEIYTRENFIKGTLVSNGYVVFNSIEAEEVPPASKMSIIGNNEPMKIENISESPDYKYFVFYLGDEVACMVSEKGDLQSRKTDCGYCVDFFNEINVVQTDFVKSTYDKQFYKNFSQRFPNAKNIPVVECEEVEDFFVTPKGETFITSTLENGENKYKKIILDTINKKIHILSLEKKPSHKKSRNQKGWQNLSVSLGISHFEGSLYYILYKNYIPVYYSKIS